MLIQRAPKPQSHFTQIRNDVARESRISLRAIGLLTRILSYPDDWRTDSAAIANEVKEGREAVRAAFRELEDVGYAVARKHRVPQSHGGFIWKTITYIYDTPEAAEEALREWRADQAAWVIEKAERDAAKERAKTGHPAPETETATNPQVTPDDGILGPRWIGNVDETEAEPGDGIPGLRWTGPPVDRAPEKAALYENCSTKTENEKENTARAPSTTTTVAPVVEPGADASVRARVSDSDVAASERPSGSTRAFQNTESSASTLVALFESAGSVPDGTAAPPNSAGPPRGRSGSQDPDFVRFWEMAPTYAPWHAPRKKTYEAWRRARKVATAGEILVAWEAYTVEWATWPEDARKFVPAETKWLDEKRWRKKVVPRDAPSLGSRVGGREQTVEDREEITRRTMAALRGEGPPVLEGRVVVGSSGHSPVRRAVG